MKIIASPKDRNEPEIDWNFPVISFDNWPFKPESIELAAKGYYVNEVGTWWPFGMVHLTKRKDFVLGRLKSGDWFVGHFDAPQLRGFTK